MKSVQTSTPRPHDGATLGLVGGTELLRDVVEREVLAEHAGMSGASLERVLLADGRRLRGQAGDRRRPTSRCGSWAGRSSGEYLLWRTGGLDRLPDRCRPRAGRRLGGGVTPRSS